jgi:ribosomal protein S6--L-glutamate ligase
VDGPPVVAKLLQGRQGIGVVLAESTAAASSVIEAFHGLDQNILIQKFIKESNGADIRALVVGRKVVAAMRRQAVSGEFRSNIHRGGTAPKLRLPADHRKTTLAAARALGLRVAGVDMIESKEGPMIMEVNSSPGLEDIEKTTGVDVAAAVIEQIEREVHPTPRKTVL